ncbi:putative Methyltransferase [Seiridium cardinale]
MPSAIDPVEHDTISTEVTYLKYDPKHHHEKLYTVNYDTGGVFPRTNALNEPKAVFVHNFRDVQSPQSFGDYGFSSTRLRSALQPGDFDAPDKVEDVFYPEAIKALRQLFPDAAKIEMLEHQIRKRHPAFPVATGEPYQNLLPTTLVHIDFTPDSATKISHAAFRAASQQYRRLLTVNLWKSLQGPGNDWPLGLCDWRTVDRDSEVEHQDVVFNDRYSENARIYYGPKHQWYYFKDLQDDEVIVFRQSDSAIQGGGGVPHTGFFNPHVDKDAAPRVSIELRAFVYFE